MDSEKAGIMEMGEKISALEEVTTSSNLHHHLARKD